ncbi:hypothetical protein TNCT_248371 [Trichonephila clavata]|uniref:Uncharacterized protein n=1 Tax=Trichonephila clavata TaxID=2740835 RepID=A0A8X6J7D8_TRICU|nr:hypothetical protein TNCT_248371 [Trichonephila clavata]
MDAKHKDCTNSGFQLVIFQVILHFPVLIDDCRKPARLPSQTSVQDVYEMPQREGRVLARFEAALTTSKRVLAYDKVITQPVVWRIVHKECTHPIMGK